MVFSSRTIRKKFQNFFKKSSKSLSYKQKWKRRKTHKKTRKKVRKNVKIYAKLTLLALYSPINKWIDRNIQRWIKSVRFWILRRITGKRTYKINFNSPWLRSPQRNSIPRPSQGRKNLHLQTNLRWTRFLHNLPHGPT